MRPTESTSAEAIGRTVVAPVRVATFSVPFGGMETWQRSLVKAMRDRDDVEVVESVWMTLPAQERLGRIPPLSLHWWLWGWWSTVTGLRAMRRRGVTADVLLFNHVNPLVMAGLARRGVPIVLNLDATPCLLTTFAKHYFGRGPRRPWVERLKFTVYRYLYRRAARIVAYSEMVKRSLIDDYGVDESRVTVVANGIDVTMWQRAPSPPTDTVRVLFVGSEFERKGGRDLLEVAGSPAMSGVEFDVVTKSAVGETPTNVCVHRGLNHTSEQLRDLYGEASIFVLPTYADFSPNVLCEAMAMSLPLVATDVGAINEMVVDGVNGFLIAPGDTPALQERLIELTDSPRLRERMGREGRSLLERSFDIRKNAAEFVAALDHARRS